MNTKNKIKLSETYYQLLLKCQNKTQNIDLEQVKYILYTCLDLIKESIYYIEQYQNENFCVLNDPNNPNDDSFVELSITLTSSIFFRVLELFSYLEESSTPLQTTATIDNYL